MIKLLGFVFIFLLAHTSFAKEEYYQSVALKKMPFDIQNTAKQIFLKHKLHEALIGPEGSKLLGLNMFFTDDFFVTRIALKYDVQGEFDKDKVYEFGKFKVLHFQMNGVTNALMFDKIELHKVRDIIQELEAIKVSDTSKRNFDFIASAYAECFMPDQYSLVEINSTLSENSASAMITKCFKSIGEGAEESTVGLATSAWSAVSGEWSKFWDDPRKRLGEYYDYAASGLEALWDFSKTLGKMIIDPIYGKKILKQKFGEIGSFFANVYNGIANLPLAQQVDLICNIIGSLGVDFLLMAVTAGAGSAKLAISATRILNKLLSISRLVGKGLTYPFKVLEKFGQKTILKLERIVESGNKALFEKKLKRLGCAI